MGYAPGSSIPKVWNRDGALKASVIPHDDNADKRLIELDFASFWYHQLSHLDHDAALNTAIEHIKSTTRAARVGLNIEGMSRGVKRVRRSPQADLSQGGGYGFGVVIEPTGKMYEMWLEVGRHFTINRHPRVIVKVGRGEADPVLAQTTSLLAAGVVPGTETNELEDRDQR